jgi:6-pyruvoyltetrahydropterin/6-carboxytetrahydropterin synthase
MSALELTRRYHFSAGHRLENPAFSPEDNERIYGQCYRQHGHNYQVEVTVTGALDPATGMAVDLGALDTAVKRLILDAVDHYDLSSTVAALRGVPTTGENLARAFWEWLEPTLPAGSLRRLVVVETDNNIFEYRGAAAR